MDSVSLATAKAHLSKLIERAARGVPVEITRRGKPVAQITAIGRPRQPIDFAALRALTATMPEQPKAMGTSCAGCGTKIVIDPLSRHIVACRCSDAGSGD